MHDQGAKALAGIYRSAADSFDWYGVHVLSAAPGVACGRGHAEVPAGTTTSTVFLALLAVDGNKVVHEEVFLDNGPSDSRKQAGRLRVHGTRAEGLSEGGGSGRGGRR